MPKGKPIEPLDLSELESNPSLDGMLAFREVPKKPIYGSLPAPTVFPPIGLTPIGVAPSISQSAPVDTLQVAVASLIKPDETAAQQSGAVTPSGITPIGSAPIGASANTQLSDILAKLACVAVPKSRGKTIRATKVEDGHSATQNALYWYLWRTGQHVNSSRSRFVQAGYGQIQSSLGIDRSNVQDAIRELRKKLSVEVLKESTVGSATVYEVYCCEDILASRKSKGLLWARRFGTRRADLLNESDMDVPTNDFKPNPLPPTGLTPTGFGPSGSEPPGVGPPVGFTPTAPTGLTPPGAVGVTPIHLVKETTSKKQPPATLLEFIVRIIHESFGVVDEDAARRILAGCYHRAPDATDREIEHYVRLHVARTRSLKRVENPIGLLISVIPKCFEGESFLRFRESEIRRLGPQGRELQVQTESESQDQAANFRLRARLLDPATPSQEKDLIRKVLG